MSGKVIEDGQDRLLVLAEDPEKTDSVGTKHFVLVDADQQDYDFRLDSLSMAIGRANPAMSIEYDRPGGRRDDKPDVGCYEYVKP